MWLISKLTQRWTIPFKVEGAGRAGTDCLQSDTVLLAFNKSERNCIL